MILIGNGNVITRQEEGTFIPNGCVVIDGTTIKEIGATATLMNKYPNAEYIDAKGGVIMPGLVNMHNHIYSTFARGMSINGYNPHNFSDILTGLWFKLDRHILNETTLLSGRVAYLDSIKNGVTTMFDHHASYGEIPGSLFELSKAADEMGIRTCLCYEISDRNGEDLMKQAVQENLDFIKATKQRTDDMQHAMVGMHAPFTLSDKTLDYVTGLTPSDVGYHIHVGEGMEDVYDSLSKYNKPLMNRLFDFGILKEKTITAHCINIGPREMELVRDTNTMIVTNPQSNMGNAVGCPPALRFMNEYNILAGLGTDGFTNDLTESLKFGNLIHKHHLADPNAGGTEIPKMMFENNPKMANRYFTTKLGVLEPGAAADVIVLDYKASTPMDESNFGAHVLFGMNGKNVTDTVIAGKIKMRNRDVIGVDEEKIFADAQQEAQKLWNRVNG